MPISEKIVFLLIASIVAVALLTFSNSIYVSTPQTANVQVTIYAGELYSANGTLVHGAFGLTSTNLSSPGPTLYFASGTVVNLTLVNIGKVGHGWALTDSPQTNATRLFNATIGSGTAPLAANKSESVTFTVGSAGTYYYICPVPGYVGLGMWGVVVIVPNTTIIPEFTSWLGIAGIFVIIIVARIMMTMKGKQKSRIKTIFL